MKKVILFFMFMVMTLSCNAQITVQKNSDVIVSNLSDCGRLSRGGDKLHNQNGTYRLYLFTSNRFDKPIIVTFESKENALLTFKDIIEKWDSMSAKDSFKIDGVTFVVCGNGSEKSLAVKDSVCAGIGAFYLESAKKAYNDLLNEK